MKCRRRTNLLVVGAAPGVVQVARIRPAAAEAAHMEMILLDWTRMGRTYCVAGACNVNGQIRIVRPLPRSQRDAPVRNTGWSPFQMDGHSRWEVFELISPEVAPPQPPHRED